MMQRGREKLTPLPEVNEQSSRVKFAIGTLALPVGLEPSWIGVNMPAFERAASLAGTHYVMVMGENGEQDEVQVAGSMGEDGSLASSAASVAKKQRGDFSSLSIDGDLNDFATIIKLNNAARKADSGDVAAQYDPYVQADLLDKTIRRQLMRISWDSNTNRGINALDAFLDYPNAFMAGQLMGTDMLQTTAGKVVMGAIIANQVVRGSVRAQKSKYLSVGPQHSYFHHHKLDRVALSAAYLATHRLIGVPRHQPTDANQTPIARHR